MKKLICFIFFVLISVSCSSPENKAKIKQDTINKTQAKTPIKVTPNWNTILFNKLSNELENLNTHSFASYDYSIDGLLLEADYFTAVADLVKEGKTNSVDSIIRISKVVGKKLISLQIKEFPKMRKSYAEYARQKVWEDNIEVKYKGTTIEFIAGVFANNKNKTDFYKMLKNVFMKLRFKRVNLKWYEYDDEYTYYTIPSLSDKEL